ncbi:U3 snoRNP protein [Coemansia brasiliensis]|uniref:U3 snoRNP protein n=1 Tax=Coemansia brasiliensis TaxID=2650707 RepID=A0A9W8LZN0_9FUNG|nr:U3 snoRNP protein [Coemansia brasiliensis]
MKDTGVTSQLNTMGGANTYRFKSFKQRADEIEINVSRRIIRDFDEPEEHGSYFAEGVRKWNELNCTKDYTEFLRRVTKYQQSLAQVLYHKDEIVEILEDYMSMDHELVVEAILDLVTLLARDLQDEVLPYYERLVQRITPLIRSDSVEIVEAACNALAYLFKYLARSLVQDLRPTFNLLSPMLGIERQKANVRRFTAESMAFLIRKLRGTALQQFVEHTVHAMLECPANRLADFRDGLALLYFECMRNVETRLHSRASAIYMALLHELYKEEFVAARLDSNDVYVLVASVTKLCLHYTRRESAQQLWAVLFEEYDAQARAVENKTAARIQPMAALLGLLTLATIVRKGSRVESYKPLFQRCKTAFSIAHSLSTDTETLQSTDNMDALALMANERIKWLVGLLMQCDVTDMVSTGKVLLDLAVSNESLSTVLSLALTLARLEWAQWNQVLLPYLIRLTVSHWESDQDELLLFWTQLFQNNLFKHQAGSISSAVTSRGQVIFPNKPATAEQPSTSIPHVLIDSLIAPVDWETVASQQHAIPTGERDEFTGFDDMDQDDDHADSSMLGATDTSSTLDVLATKSALLSVLAHVAVDPTVLLDGLSAFVTQLVDAVVQNTAQIAQGSEFLQAAAVYNNTSDNSDIWDDDASRALGLFAFRESRMYWGSYHQLFPMVGLLGRALKLMADTALHAPPSLAASKLIDVWCLTLDQILPTHASNSLLMVGMYKIADALKFASSTQRSGDDIQPETKLKLEAALSLQQLELIMPLVESNLSSMQLSLRLHTLQLLSSFEQPTMSGSKKTEETCPVVQMGIELESTASDLDSYKNRLNYLRQMAVIASNGRVPEIYRRIFPSLAAAQYSLNFSYIWPEVTKQLGLLAGADQELFWNIAWSFVQRFGDERQLIETGPTPEAKKWLNNCMESWIAETEYLSPSKIDGHAIECPNFARVSRVYDAEAERLADKDKQHLQQLAAMASCPDTTRIDYTNVQKQLMTMLAEVGAAAAEGHSKPVVLAFLAFIRYRFGWTASFFNKHAGTELGLDVDSTGIFALEHSGLLTERNRRVDEQQCILWLRLLAKFRNPQQLHRSPVLYSLFLRMLTRGDNELQRHALECVLAWRQSSINPYADNLRSLVDEKRFHDELKTFDLAVNGESINIVHREQLVPIVLRILHGQMMVRNGKSSRKDGMRIRRAVILNAMVGITQDELRFFVGIGLETFRETIARATPRELIVNTESSEVFSLTYNVAAASSTDKTDSMDVDGIAENASDTISEYVAAGAEMDSISSKAQVSFLHLLSELIRNLGIKATPVFHESLAVLLSSIAWAQRQLDIANDELGDMLVAEQTDTAEQSASDNDESDTESVASDDEDTAKEKIATDGSKPGQSVREELEHRKSIAREIRQLAIKCLTRMFMLMPPDFSFTPYMQCIYEVAVDPRIDNLATENSQNSSALLLLLKSWTLLPKYFSYLIEYNPLTFPMLLDILVAPKVQPAVVTLVLNVLQVLLEYDCDVAVKKHEMSLEHAEQCGQLVKNTIQHHVSRILSHMRVCFANANLQAATSQSISGGSGNLIMHQIHILSRVAEYATEETHDAKALLDLLLPALKRPNSVVPVRAKGDVLNIMLRFIPLVLNPKVSDIPRSEQQHLLVGYLNVISSSFGRLRLDSARKTLTHIMTQMARIDRELREITTTQLTSLENAAWIIEEINAYSTSRLNEPDHDRRLAAYEKLNEKLWSKPELLDAYAWTPLLHNLVFYAQEQEELATRSNAAFGLARFVSRTAQAFAADAQSDEAQTMSRNMKSILLPSIKHMLASKHEVVQIEFLNVLRKAVRECGQYFEQLQDLMVLDTKDEEANFFYNILHIQTHRRTRAMRRFRESILANVQDHHQSTTDTNSMEVDSSESDVESDEEVKALKPRKKIRSTVKAIQPLVFNSEQAAPISPVNIRAIIMPLLENWALAEGAQLNHDLSNEAIQTIGVLAAVLPWSQYNATLHKYMAMAKKTPSLEKRLLRLIMGMLDHFHFDLRHVKVDGLGRLLADDAAVPSGKDIAIASTSNDEGEEEEADAEVVSEQSLRDERIHKVVVTFLMPELKKMVAETDEEKLMLRAPVAMAIVRILTALPVSTMNAQLPGVLTTICNMLRAKAQSARNATRETLVRILKFLGPQYFGFLVKELRASLYHGAQKHILSYTIYALLREIIDSLNVGDLDYTLEPVIEILIQDIFGQTGDDKDSEDWITKIREAKVHHGPDCFEMLASVTPFDNIRLMLVPLRDILRETDTPKRTKVVDNVLRRISIGISHNQAYDTKSVLIFCHNIINQYLAMSTKSAKDTQKIKEEAEQLKRLRFASSEDYVTVHVRRSDMAPKRDYLQANAHRFVQFGLEILYHGLKRERFDTKSAEVLGMLDPFVDLTGDGLYSRYNSIISLCCKIWAIMVRLPLPSIPNGIPVVIRRLFAIFHQAASTNSDMIQNCFKLLASLLRSKHAEKMMADYEPEELDMSEVPKDEEASTKKSKKSKKGKPVAARISADCMKNSLISEEQLRDLIDFIRPDIEETERQSTAFSLIRAILTRRMIVDSLYKLLDTIRELMISAQDAKMRELCRLTWFQFLMDYPLGERRLANAMSFIVQNASGFVFESGRVSALEVMGVIINRFADELLLPNAAEPFFLGLVLIIAKDESSQCREMAMYLLPILIARFDQPRLARAWLLLDQWAAGITSSAEPISESEDKKIAELKVARAKQRELGRAALQCYGIIVEPLGDRFAKRVPAFLSVVDSALTVSLKTWKQAEMRLNHQSIGGIENAGDLESIAADLHSGSDPHNEALMYWETAYLALNAYGRLTKSLPQYAVGNTGQSRIWLLAAKHLNHPHAWVRLSAARLIGAYVGMADPSWMLEAEKSWKQQDNISDWEVPDYQGVSKYVLLSVQMLKQIAQGSVIQLNSRFLSAELGNQAVKNLYFIARCFLTAVPQQQDEIPESAEQQQDDASSSDSASDSDEDDNQTSSGADLSIERSLSWLINRIGSLARTELIRGRGSTEKRSYCFKWFAAVISLVPPSLLTNSAYIMPIISPLYRTTQDSQLPANPITLPDGTVKTPTEQLDGIKALANEVIRLLQDRMGVTAFSAVLIKVQKHVNQVRDQRREQRKQLAVIDPELHSKKKLRKHESARRKRQERLSEKARKKVRIVVRRAYNTDNSAN